MIEVIKMIPTWLSYVVPVLVVFVALFLTYFTIRGLKNTSRYILEISKSPWGIILFIVVLVTIIVLLVYAKNKIGGVLS